MAATQDEIASYTDWKDWRAEDFGQFRRGDARYFGWLLAQCPGAPVRQVLELGFGNGQFLGWARAQGMQVAGIETQPALLARAQAAGLAAWGTVDALPADARYDLIAAFDVLEHIPQDQLIGLVGSLAGRLAPGGHIVCRVPNGESPLGRMHQHGDLTHCSTLGVSKFRQIGAALGLQVQGLGEAPWQALQHAGRSPKNLLRALLRRLIERCLAFAYRWDADTLAPNVLVRLYRPPR